MYDLQVDSSILNFEMGDEKGSTVNVTTAQKKIFLTLAMKPSLLQDNLEYYFQRYGISGDSFTRCYLDFAVDL